MAKHEELTQEEIQAKVEYLFAHRANRTLHAYIDIAGDLVAGALLSQIMYWFSDGKSGNPRVSIYRDGYYWLAKRREDWMDEIRISKKQYDCAIKKLTAEIEPTEEEKKKNPGNKGKRREKKFDKDKALVEVKTFHYHGIPMTHIRPITENINREIAKWKKALADEILGENSNACSLNSPNGKLVNSPNVNMEIDEKENSYNIYNIDNTNTEITNSDFSTENTDKYALKDKSFKDGNMYASVSGKQEDEPNPQKKSRYIPKDYTEEQLREHIRPTIRENFERIEFENELKHIPDGEKLLEDITVEFFRQYEENMGVKHNILPDKSYVNVIRMFVCSSDELRYYFDFETYSIMIEHYFKTDFNRRGNYDGEVTLCLSHFMSDAIRTHLLNREGILWERAEDEED